MPQVPWVDRMMLGIFLWDKMGEADLGFKCALAGLLMRVMYSLGGYQALPDVCLCTKMVLGVAM